MDEESTNPKAASPPDVLELEYAHTVYKFAPPWMYRTALASFAVPTLFQFICVAWPLLRTHEPLLSRESYLPTILLTPFFWGTGVLFTVLYLQKARHDPELPLHLREDRRGWLLMWLMQAPVFQVACILWMLVSNH